MLKELSASPIVKLTQNVYKIASSQGDTIHVAVGGVAWQNHASRIDNHIYMLATSTFVNAPIMSADPLYIRY